MSAPLFTKASKKQAKLRAALFGPSGSGKTFTALRIASGLGGLIAVIDTERGSASKYSDRFTFDVCELKDKSIDGYCSVLREATGYDVLIIDSLSHAWQELLEQVEKLAQAKYRGNTWSAWSEGTPMQRLLIDALLSFPGHVIVTMRSKTEWTVESNEKGKSAPKRVGLAPEQGKGIEYEFDLLMELTTDHLGSIIKDRTGKFQDKIIEKPGEEFGQELSAWLSNGEVPAPPVPAPEPPPQLTDDEAKAKNIAAYKAFIEKERPTDMTPEAWQSSFATMLGREIDYVGEIYDLNELPLAALREGWKLRRKALDATKAAIAALPKK